MFERCRVSPQFDVAAPELFRSRLASARRADQQSPKSQTRTSSADRRQGKAIPAGATDAARGLTRPVAVGTINSPGIDIIHAASAPLLSRRSALSHGR